MPKKNAHKDDQRYGPDPLEGIRDSAGQISSRSNTAITHRQAHSVVLDTQMFNFTGAQRIHHERISALTIPEPKRCPKTQHN